MPLNNHLRQRVLFLKPLLLGLFIGLTLFSRTLSITGLVAFIAVWLLHTSTQEKISLLSRRKTLLLLPLLFILYALSLLYSQHSGTSYLEKSLLLLIVPLVVGSTSLTPKELIIILKIFVLSCFAFTLLSMAEAYRFYNLPTEHFTIQHLPHQLSDKLHAPYLALFLLLANLFLIIIYQHDQKHGTVKVFLFIYFTLFMLILSSRTALFCNIILIGTYLYHKLGRTNKRWLFFIALLAVAGVIVLTFLYFPHFKERVTAISKEGNGISDRAIVFRASFMLLKDNPLVGVGVGDIQPELNKIYSSWNLSDYFFQLNTHNQYLATGLAIGAIGIVILLYLLLKPIRLALAVKRPWYAAVYLIFSLSFMTEVILSRYWGVASFSFFYTIFTAYLIDKKIEKTDGVMDTAA